MKKRLPFIILCIIALIAGILIIIIPAYSKLIIAVAVLLMLLAFVLFRKRFHKIPKQWPVMVLVVFLLLTGIFLLLHLVFESRNPALARTFNSIFSVALRIDLIVSIVVALILRKQQQKADIEKNKEN